VSRPTSTTCQHQAPPQVCYGGCGRPARLQNQWRMSWCCDSCEDDSSHDDGCTDRSHNNRFAQVGDGHRLKPIGDLERAVCESPEGPHGGAALIFTTDGLVEADVRTRTRTAICVAMILAGCRTLPGATMRAATAARSAHLSPCAATATATLSRSVRLARARSTFARRATSSHRTAAARPSRR